LIPQDRTEAERLDMMHTMFKTIRDKGSRLTDCPTDMLKREVRGWQEPPRVLDLGCGPGNWMLDMAVHFRDAEFVGVDLHRMGPPNIEPNVAFKAPWDYEGPWAWGERSWDLIHLQMGLGSVSNWYALYQKILDHLIPGTGYFESVELDYEPRAEDGKSHPGRLMDWWEVYVKGHYDAMGRRIHYDPATPEILRRMGFKDVVHKEYKIPLSEWHRDVAKTRASKWWQISMGLNGDGSGGQGLEAICLMPLCKYSSWSADHVRRLCNEAMAQAKDPTARFYNVLHVITARAPGADEVG
jgi:SAM-dependent methyltransferase